MLEEDRNAHANLSTTSPSGTLTNCFNRKFIFNRLRSPAGSIPKFRNSDSIFA